MAFVRFEPSLSKERLAAGLRDELGHVVWSQTNDEHDHIYPFVLELPPGFGRVALEVVVLTPVQTEFVVKPPRVE